MENQINPQKKRQMTRPSDHLTVHNWTVLFWNCIWWGESFGRVPTINGPFFLVPIYISSLTFWPKCIVWVEMSVIGKFSGRNAYFVERRLFRTLLTKNTMLELNSRCQAATSTKHTNNGPRHADSKQSRSRTLARNQSPIKNKQKELFNKNCY